MQGGDPCRDAAEDQPTQPLPVGIGVKAIAVGIPRLDRDTNPERRRRVHDQSGCLRVGAIDHGQGGTARAAEQRDGDAGRGKPPEGRRRDDHRPEPGRAERACHPEAGVAGVGRNQRSGGDTFRVVHGRPAGWQRTRGDTPAPLGHLGQAGPQRRHGQRLTSDGPAPLGQRGQAARSNCERGSQSPSVIGGLGGVQARRNDQVGAIELAQHEIVGLQPHGRQMVPAPPIEHALRSPGVQDADPGRHGQIVQARDGPVADDPGAGQHDQGGGRGRGGDRLVRRLNPIVVTCGHRRDRALDRLIRFQGEAKLYLP